MTHRIQLDTFRKYRNASEWRPVNRARCQHIESTGDGDNITKVARAMLAEGITGDVVVYRGQTPVFLTGTVEEWASGSFGRKEQPEQLKRQGQ